MKKHRKKLREDLYNMLWRYRFSGGISTKEATDIFAEYVEINYKPRKHGSTRGKAVEKDTEAPA
jgi:hypothetical protein